MNRYAACLALLAAAFLFAADLPLREFRPVNASKCRLQDGILKVEAAGRHAGVSVSVPATPGRRTVYRCEVRGAGKVQCGINGRFGWSYGKAPIELSAEWQTMAVSYADAAPASTFSLFLPSGANEATFEVRNLTAAVEEAPALADLAVPPVCLRGAERPGTFARVRKVDGQEVVWGKRWYYGARLPVPATTRPVHYYARMRRQGAEEASAVLYHLGSRQRVTPYVKFADGDDWQWLHFGPVPAFAAFPEAVLQFSGSPKAEFFLDRIVITTEASLAPAQLDALPPPIPVPSSASVAVGRGTPAIDGRLDDDAWRHSIPLAPFILQGRSAFAVEQTTARLLWDDECLYLSFRCQESALAPSANRLHEFKRGHARHDDLKASQDDCVVALLRHPSAPGHAFELLVSATGAILDCKSPLQDLWGRRDPGWESGARAAVAVYNVEKDGHWAAEVAVPWKTLGGLPDAPLQIKLGRFEKPAKEQSSYQPIQGAGLHENADFFEARLVGAVPTADFAAWPEFIPGANRLALRSDAPLLLGARIAFDRQPAAVIGGASALNFNLDGNGTFRFQWDAADAALRPLLRSPQYRLALSAQRLEARLPRGVRLAVNGRPAPQGAALASGLNELELQAPEGADARLSVAGAPIPFPEGWKKAAPGRWQLTLADGATELWPNWKADALHVARGGLQQLLFAPRGFPGRTARDYAVVLDLPSGIRLLGASGYYEVYEVKHRQMPASPLGKGWTRWRIEIAGPRPWKPALPGHHYLAAFLAVDEDAAGGDAFYFHAESPADALAEAPQRVPLVLLPRIQGSQPRRLGVRMSTGWLPSLRDKSLYTPLVEFFRGMGLTCVNAALRNHCNLLPQSTFFHFKEWNFSFAPYVKAHPRKALVDLRGRRSDFLVCPREILGAPECRAFILATLPKWHKRLGYVTNINWDFEENVLHSQIACFCDDCRAEFAKGAKLPGVPSAREIAERHLPAWTDFMTTRFADLAQLFRDSIHQTLPGVILSVYSGYECEDTHSQYGVDWRKLDGRIDLAVLGYGRDLATLQATRAALKRTPFQLGAILRPYEYGNKRPVPPCTLAQVMRRAIDANNGFFVYTFPCMDARSFTAIARASSILARHEAFFLRSENHPEKLAAAGLPEADNALLHDGDGHWLLILLNPGTKPRKVKLDAARLGLPGLPAEVTIPPGDALVLP